MNPDTQATSRPDAIDAKAIGLALLVAVSFALLVRIPLFVGLDFPLNDGGLFLAMTEAIRDTGFSLPAVVEYNGLELPMAYPPLGFFLVAAISQLFGLEPLTVQIYLPLAFNLGTVVLFVLLAARLLDRPSMLFYAACALPLIPRSYEWLIMGGGVTRSPGFFLMMISALLALRVARQPGSVKRIVLCTLCLGLTLSTHLEWGVTAWVSTTVLMLSVERSRRQVVNAIVMGFGMGVVSAPWWITVIARHGIDPFLAASATAGWDEVSLGMRLQAFDLFTLRNSWTAVLGAIGLAVAIHQKRFLPVVWLLAIYITTPRHGATAAAVPVALLIGIALSFACDQAADAYIRWRENRPTPVEGEPRVVALQLAQAFALIVLFAALADDTQERQELSPLASLTAEERAGMAWIRENTSEQDRFLVVSEARDWAVDRTAEWFPVLTGRVAANTAQGVEWIEGERFAQLKLIGDVHRQVATMSPSNAPPIGRKLFDRAHTHVVVFAAPDNPIHITYNQSSIYELVHSQPRMSVLRLRGLEVSQIE